MREWRRCVTLAGDGVESPNWVDWEAMKPPPEKAEVESNWLLENIAETVGERNLSEKGKRGKVGHVMIWCYLYLGFGNANDLPANLVSTFNFPAKSSSCSFTYFLTRLLWVKSNLSFSFLFKLIGNSNCFLNKILFSLYFSQSYDRMEFSHKNKCHSSTNTGD